MSTQNTENTKRRRLAPAVVAAGALGTAVLALSMTGTLSAFTAAITNSVNTTGLGTLTMQETSGAITCNSTDGNSTNTATCATINKYGGQTLVPGGSSTTTVSIKNTGTATPTTFTLTPGACTQSGTAPAGVTAATDLCSQVTVKLYAAATATGTPIYSGSLTGWANAAQSLTTLAGNAAQAYTFVVSTPSSLGNTYQNQSVSQPLVWQFA